MEVTSARYPECKYWWSRSDALTRLKLWVMAPGLMQDRNGEEWIPRYIEQVSNACGGAVLCINPHWRQSVSGIDEYQWQLEEVVSIWVDSTETTRAEIGFIGFSEGGTQILRFLLTSSSVHKLLHSENSGIKISGLLLMDPLPLEEDELKVKCPSHGTNLALQCLQPLLHRAQIFSVDGEMKGTDYDIQRLAVGVFTAEMLQLQHSPVLVVVPNVRHCDLPVAVLSQVKAYSSKNDENERYVDVACDLVDSNDIGYVSNDSSKDGQIK